jgi:3-oxoadipate enol-lactonase
VRNTVQRVDIRSGGWAVRSVVPARPDQRALLSGVTTPVMVVANYFEGSVSVIDL